MADCLAPLGNQARSKLSDMSVGNWERVKEIFNLAVDAASTAETLPGSSMINFESQAVVALRSELLMLRIAFRTAW
jgi:hypothetical protein